MVSCNLLGRFGNQAMIAATTIAYALRHGLEYHIPAHTLNDNVWKPMFTHLENPKWNPYLPTVIVRENGHQYQEIGTYGYDPIIEEAKDFAFAKQFNIIIDGYRQSLKYFEDYLPEVRKAFGFDYEIKKKNTVAIHVRRGDYLLYPTRHPVVTFKYVADAVYLLSEKLKWLKTGKLKFEFYSDDIEWCKETFLGFNKLFDDVLHSDIVSFSEYKTEIEDFQSMLECEHFIISNSTFSLMAAILSESPKKIVISPDESNWFGSGNAHLDVSDLIPKDYIRIKY
jgi:hypothetical protein